MSAIDHLELLEGTAEYARVLLVLAKLQQQQGAHPCAAQAVEWLEFVGASATSGAAIERAKRQSSGRNGGGL